MRSEEIIIIAILIFIILFFLNKKENYDELVNYKDQQNNKICLDEKKLYGNFLQDDSSCMCSSVYEPVECNDKKFNNLCEAKCAGVDINTCSKISSFIDKNYNKDNDKLYRNFNNYSIPDLNLIQTEQNDDNLCMCSAIYDPIDCNGRIYDNLCDAKCAKENLSECSNKTWNIVDNNNLDYDINSLITEES